MTKLPEYSEVWISCQCGHRIGGTSFADEAFKFTCLHCWRIHNGWAPESGEMADFNGAETFTRFARDGE